MLTKLIVAIILQHIYTYIKSLCCIPKTITMLYVNYSSIKLESKKIEDCSTMVYNHGIIMVCSYTKILCDL